LNPKKAKAIYDIGVGFADIPQGLGEPWEQLSENLKQDFSVGSAAFWLGIAPLLAQTDNSEEAEDAYRRSIEIEPDNANAWYGLGALMEKLERAVEARDAYRKSVQIQPDLAEARNITVRTVIIQEDLVNSILQDIGSKLHRTTRRGLRDLCSAEDEIRREAVNNVAYWLAGTWDKTFPNHDGDISFVEGPEFLQALRPIRRIAEPLEEAILEYLDDVEDYRTEALLSFTGRGPEFVRWLGLLISCVRYTGNHAACEPIVDKLDEWLDNEHQSAGKLMVRAVIGEFEKLFPK
ncbi:MAG: tetratricopeptide repeat protein, partial [Candidatus Thorarchaeota archaeon]